MKKHSQNTYIYDDENYEEAELRANTFNLIFSLACVILALAVILLELLGVFTAEKGLQSLFLQVPSSYF